MDQADKMLALADREQLPVWAAMGALEVSAARARAARVEQVPRQAQVRPAVQAVPGAAQRGKAVAAEAPRAQGAKPVAVALEAPVASQVKAAAQVPVVSPVKVAPELAEAEAARAAQRAQKAEAVVLADMAGAVVVARCRLRRAVRLPRVGQCWCQCVGDTASIRRRLPMRSTTHGSQPIHQSH